MGWIEILILMIIAGAFGGLLDVLQLIDIRKLIEQGGPILSSKRRFAGALCLGCTGGAGGSLAMLFVVAATAKLDTSDSAPNRLMLISLGVVSGFLGYRVLRSVAQRVEKQIQEVEARTDRKIQESVARVEATTEKKIAENAMRAEYFEAVNLGLLVAENRNAPLSANLEAISRLEEFVKQAPDDRQASIILSNIYAKTEDYDKAIKILTDLINVLETKGPGRKMDVGDALYNRACMLNLMADKHSEDTQRRQELRQKTFEDLESAVQLSPLNKEQAKSDTDLKSLAGEDRFKRLTA